MAATRTGGEPSTRERMLTKRRTHMEQLLSKSVSTLGKSSESRCRTQSLIGRFGASMLGTPRLLPDTPESLDALPEALKFLTVPPARSALSKEPAMDVLSDVIRVVRLSGAVFFTAEFSSPWALESPNADLLADIVMPDAECVVLFHILMDGACIVQCAGCAPARLAAHDVIVFPHGEPHTMRSDEGAASDTDGFGVSAAAGKCAASGDVRWRRPHVAVHLRVSQLRSAVRAALERAPHDAGGAQPQ